MTPLFKKLNYKAPAEIVVINAPQSFDAESKAMVKVTAVKTAWPQSVDFVIGFGTKQKDVDAFATQSAALASADAVIWFAYPKGTSKKYKCEFNRDTGWAKFGELGYEPVRQVAIDDDWSALRFRRVENIKKMTRSFAMSEKGKEKVKSAKKGK